MKEQSICKDCIFDGVCRFVFDGYLLASYEYCRHFKNKADFAEVVRCEKCRYFFDNHCNHPKNKVSYKVPDFGQHYSYQEGTSVALNHFCSYGERKQQ